MNQLQRELWEKLSQAEKQGKGAVYEVYQRALQSAGTSSEALADLTLVLEWKSMDAFDSERESTQLYPALYDMAVFYAKGHLGREGYHSFCQSIFQEYTRVWLKEILQ